MMQNYDEKRVERKKEFLEKYLDHTNIIDAAGAIGAPACTIAKWMANDPDFKAEVEHLRKIRDFVRADKEEAFLHLVGTGVIKTGKETGINMANVVAAKMGLVARDSKRWSERISVDKTSTRTIKLITVHAGDQEESTIIDSTDYKELPSGEGPDGGSEG